MCNEISVKTGKISYIKSDKGYGFIRDNLGKSLFFHATRVVSPAFGALNVGNHVEYTEKQADKGNMAIDIVVTD